MKNSFLGSRTLRQVTVFLFVLIISLFIACTSSDAEEKHRTLKVAFPQSPGYSETDENGRRSGLLVDYLNEISKYTNWEYEYIDVDKSSIESDFAKGNFDLVGGIYYPDKNKADYGVPKYCLGYRKAVLFSKSSDERFFSHDLQTLNGKTIGVDKDADDDLANLKRFLKSHHLKCNLVRYDSKNNDNYPLNKILENDNIDLVLGNSMENSSELQIVTIFNSRPHYIVTQPDEKELLAELNTALFQILEANPNFPEECYEKHYPDVNLYNLQLNKNELNYIKQKKQVTVTVSDSFHPLFCKTTESAFHNGIVPDVLKKISEFSGLTFKYIYADTYEEAVSLVQNGKADMLGFFLDTAETAEKRNLVLTKKYVTLNNIIVRNRSVTYPSKNLTGGILKGREMPKVLASDKINTYSDINEALSLVNSGSLDYFYGLSVRLEQYIQQYQYRNLIPVTLTEYQNDISFAFQRPIKNELISIINKSLNNISQTEKGAIMEQNLISVGMKEVTFTEMIYAHPFLFIVIVVLLIITVASIIIFRSRMRATRAIGNQKKADAESKAKSEFLSRISHELRTPMNAIVGLTNLTSMMDDVPTPIQNNLGKIKSSSSYLLALINDILDTGQIESGKMSVINEQFSLNHLISELQSILRPEAKKHSLDFEIRTSITHSDLLGDSIRLQQVLINLLTNSLKFTPDGGSVVLKVTETSSTKTNATFLFQVIDTGIGIAKENQVRIFVPFEQLGSSHSRSQGTGLGLSISRNIVQLMGGELKLHSTLNHGSEFYFTLSFTLYSPTNEKTVLKSKSQESLQNLQILLAEDNELNAEIAISLLEMQGATVTHACDGEVVVQMFEKSNLEQYDIILMDVLMPRQNGLEATKAIRKLKRPDALTIPIIAMTANSGQEAYHDAIDSGMTAFLTKPLDIEKLYELIEHYTH